MSVGAVFQTAGDPWVHTVIAKNADRHAEQFEPDAYDEVLTVPFADGSTDALRATTDPGAPLADRATCLRRWGSRCTRRISSVRRGNGDRPGHLAMSPHRRPPHGRLTWIEPDGRHERTSAWQDRDAATAFGGRGSGVPAHPTGLRTLSGKTTVGLTWASAMPTQKGSPDSALSLDFLGVP